MRLLSCWFTHDFFPSVCRFIFATPEFSLLRQCVFASFSRSLPYRSRCARAFARSLTAEDVLDSQWVCAAARSATQTSFSSVAIVVHGVDDSCPSERDVMKWSDI